MSGSASTLAPSVEAAGATSAPPRSWILGPWHDWALFIGTPVLILPLVFLALGRFKAEDLSLFVASFGALGHHFPGMLRAYGDRDLFRRFRVRFIVAPLFLAAVCVFCSLRELSGLTLVIYMWGVWHGLAQTYGFARIYDSKVRSTAPLTCRLDMAMCVAWFGAGVLLSPTRMNRLITTFYESGGPLLPGALLQGLRVVAIVGLVGVTLAFLVNLGVHWRAGRRPSSLKLVLMASSFAFWWYTNVTISSLLVGVVMFEIFHDVQYLSIVWAFNLKRAESGGHLGGFSRFLFRRSGVLVGAYVGLVFAYGALNFVADGVPSEGLKRFLMGVLGASALMHFYYDGFIWKVREKSTRQSLGLAGGTDARAAVGLPPWLSHGGKWLVFLVPLAVLGVAQARGLAPELERSRSLARAFGLVDQRIDYGMKLLASGDFRGAAETMRSVLEQDSSHATARAALGDAQLALGELEPARESFRSALALDANQAAAHNGLGNLLLLQGQPDAAIAEYRLALELDPELTSARGNLGSSLARQGKWEEALLHQRRMLEEQPDAEPVYLNLARTLGAAGRAAEAFEVCREGLALFPESVAIHFDFANLLADNQQPEVALEEFRALLRLEPDHLEGRQGLANTLVGLGRMEEAMAAYRLVIAANPAFFDAHFNLGLVQRSLGQLEAAEGSLRTALRLDPESNDARLALAETLRGLGRTTGR